MKSSVKKSVVKKAPRAVAAVAPKAAKPLLNVVPLDDVIKIVSNVLFDARTSLDPIVTEIRELMERARQSLIADSIVSGAVSGVGRQVVTSTDVKPILLSDSHRVSLESLFGGEPLSKPDDVVRFSHRLSTVKLNGPDGEAAFVTIPLDTLERLEARRPVDTTLKEMIERGFSDYLEGLINGVF